MGLLDSIEKGLERAVNGAFARTFRSGLQPIELSAALKRELDANAAVVARDRVLVPNVFTLVLNDTDHARMSRLGNALQQELLGVIHEHARSHGYQFPGPVRLQLTASSTLAVGQLDVTSETSQGQVEWVPVLEANGKRYRLRTGPNILGRGTEATIDLGDSGTSRQHAEVVWDGHHARLADLGSTNGTQLNGAPVRRRVVLEPDAVITIGRTNLVFRVLARSGDAPASGGRR